MKKLIVAVLFMTVAGATKAQFIDKQTVPDAVTKSFTSSYAAAQEDVWQKDGKKFKVSFKTDTVAHVVSFDDAGKTVYHQYTVDVNSVPKDVTTSGAKVYPELNVQSADKVEDNDKVYYFLSFKNGDTPLKVQVSEKGTVMKVFDAE